MSGRLPLMVLTGAGISVESGIPPFRGEGGLWTRYDPFEYGHIETFKMHPERTWKMLREIIDGSMEAEPNEAHRSLARMERRGWIGPVVTQNVDGLHRTAGSEDIMELHGNARTIRCMGCGSREVLSKETYLDLDPKCTCGGWKRPDVVLFGEMLPEREILRALAAASSGVHLLVIGTSGMVQPASMIPYQVRSSGGMILEVNPNRSEYSGSISNHFIQARATEGVAAVEEAFIEIFGGGPG